MVSSLWDGVHIVAVVRNLPIITTLRLRYRSVGSEGEPVEPELLGGLFLSVGE